MNASLGNLLDQNQQALGRNAPAAASTATDMPPGACSDCPVRGQSACSQLAEEGLQAVNRLGHRRRVARGETIAWAGDESLTCANVLSGMLKLSASTADGREQVVGLLYASDFVGRLYADKHEFTVTALSDAEMCFFPRGEFELLLDGYPSLERELFRRTLSTLDDARAQMLMLARQSAAERVADFLLRTADRIGGCAAVPGGPVTFDMPLSRGAMADVLGLTIETVSRQMTRLKAAGVIALPGARTVTLVRRGELKALACAA